FLSGSLKADEIGRKAGRAVYECALEVDQMEPAGKLSSGAVRIERRTEGLRGDAFAGLRSMPEPEQLNGTDQKAAHDLVRKELDRFKATAASVRLGRFRTEKRALQ